MTKEIRIWVKEYLVRHAKRRLRVTDIPDDANLVELGILDSLGFVGLMAAIQERYGLALDLERRPIEDFVRLGPLVEQIAETMSRGSVAAYG